MKRNLPIFIPKLLLTVCLLHVSVPEEEFNRKAAYNFIPKINWNTSEIFSNLFLWKILPQQMEIIIDDIAEVLAVADAKKILDQYYHEGKGSDPVCIFTKLFFRFMILKQERNAAFIILPNLLFLLLSVRFIRFLKDKFNIA